MERCITHPLMDNFCNNMQRGQSLPERGWAPNIIDKCTGVKVRGDGVPGPHKLTASVPGRHKFVFVGGTIAVVI